MSCNVSEEQLWCWIDDDAPELAAHLPECPRCRKLAAEATGNLARVVRQEQQNRIAHLLAALPPEQREVICLRHGDELSRAEIAYALDIPESTVKSRLFQGLKKLREHTSLLEDN